MARIAITTGDTAGSSRRAATDYGTRKTERQFPGQYVGDAGVETLEVHFTYATLPTYGVDGLIAVIPQYAKILSADLAVTTAFAGGTSLAFGLHQTDGTEIDADGLITAASGALANIDAVGDRLTGAGALIGARTSAAGNITATAVGTFTAGEAALRVEYVRLIDGIA